MPLPAPATRILATALLALAGAAAPLSGQRPSAEDDCPRAARACGRPLVERGSLVTLLSAAGALVLVAPAADATMDLLGLRSGDDGNLYGFIVSAPATTVPGAALGAWLFSRGPEPFRYHAAAALAGAYIPMVTLAYLESGLGSGASGHVSGVAFFGSPLLASMVAMRAPDLDLEVHLSGAWLTAPLREAPCGSDRYGCAGPGFGEADLDRPGRPFTGSVGAYRRTGGPWVLGVDLTGLAVEDLYRSGVRTDGGTLSGDSTVLRSRKNRVATALLLTGRRTVTTLPGFSLEAEVGLGLTSYHDRAAPGAALGLSLVRPVAPGTDAAIRARGLWLDGVPVLEVGLSLRLSPTGGDAASSQKPGGR